jgi:hypothetical protein
MGFGDAFHSRSQVAHPDWMSTPDAGAAELVIDPNLP